MEFNQSTRREQALQWERIFKLPCIMLFFCLLCALFGISDSADATPAPANAVLSVQAYATYLTGGASSRQEVVYSERVNAIVAALEAILLTPSTQTVTAIPSTNVLLSQVLTNAGNIESKYVFALQNNATGCPSTSYALTGVQLIRDVNANGAVDASDTVINLNGSDTLSLKVGEAASLLIQASTPQLSTGVACLALKATTQLQNVSASGLNTVNLSTGASLALNKSVSTAGPLQRGASEVTFNITANNVGLSAASATNVTSTGSAILVDGIQKSYLIIRDLIPNGMAYVNGSLKTAMMGAVRLFRLAGDPLYSYRSESGESGSAIEVAIGLPSGIASNATAGMSFNAQVLGNAPESIVNVANAEYYDGARVLSSASNGVVVPVASSTLGLAIEAGFVQPQYDNNGSFDGTGVVTLTFRGRNYGSADLYNVQIQDVLEGGSTFGSYQSTGTLAQNQYRIVNNSLKVLSVTGNSAIAVNNAFTGQPSQNLMLSSNSTLKAGGEFVVELKVLLNLTNRTSVFYNSATMTATLSSGSTEVLADVSTNGVSPDADSDGNPGNDSNATPIDPRIPQLQLSKTSTKPVRVSSGVYDIEYTLTLHNAGAVSAPHVRVMDNLNCAFNIGDSSSPFMSWSLIKAPQASNGLLTVSSTFTGAATCDKTGLNSTNPMNAPTNPELSLTDGNHPLAPNETEVIKFTVRAHVSPAYLNKRNEAVNKAWVTSYQDGTITSVSLMQASAASVTSTMIDPQGIVYDSVSRTPIPGAKVKINRVSCAATSPTPITASQVVNGTDSSYSYDAADGSLTITTDSNGEYQFFMQVPPAPADLCQYNISITPPSGYTYPSSRITPNAGVFTSCGDVVTNADAPNGSDSTDYYLQVQSGISAAGSCEVLHNHIPLDPTTTITGLVLKKEGSKKEAEFGDFIEYQLTLTNNTGTSRTAPKIIDQLPPGFAYVKGTSRINGRIASDPDGGTGPTLTYDLPDLTLADSGTVVIKYRLRIGVGAPTTGYSVNRAKAYANGYESNQASWRVKLSGGAFSDDAFAFGRVYLGCLAKNDDHEKLESRKDFIGVPGVRLFLEDGSNVTTDKDGKWSLYGLKSITHVIKVDPITLPVGSRLVPLSSRNAGVGDSRFLDVKKGEFLRADFLIDSCGENTATLQEQVASRVKGYVDIPDSTYNARLTYTTTSTTTSGSTVASGVSAGGSAGSVGSGTSVTNVPLISLPSTTGDVIATQPQVPQSSAVSIPTPSPIPSIASGSTDLLDPQVAPSVVELEEILPTQADNNPGFLGLQDGDTVPSKMINIRVKGPKGALLVVSVNDSELSEKQVGKKATLDSKDLEAWEYIGVALKPGRNVFALSVMDGFGNKRAERRIGVTAPDALAHLVFEFPKEARADPRKAIPVRLKLTDSEGVPVTSRTFVTLTQEQGGWLNKDLNPQEPGLQIAIEGGSAQLEYIPPAQPGDVRIQASAGALKEIVSLRLLPEQRPLVGIGIVEGVLDLSDRGAISLGKPGSANAFETELKGMSRESSNSRAAGRSAFFVKGSIKGEYLLTAAFDSDKTTSDRLFRDIRPDEYYPVYGDNSIRGYDAQSSQRLYVRIDKNRSYLLYGDFTTASSDEVRKLSQYSRTLNGAKHQYDDGSKRIISFASRTRSSQIVEELRALGISGPYYLTKISAGDLMAGSEKVEIIVRDRSQPNIILSTTAATRYSEYTIEALTGRLMFVNPVSSYDENLNPRSIRVTYEADLAGPEYTVAGTDAQFKVGNNVQLGVVAVKDDNPDNPRTIKGLTALARMGNTTVVAETVTTNSQDKGDGTGSRLEVRHDTTNLRAIIQAFKTSSSFDNPSGGATAGRTEVNGRAEYKISDTSRLKAEVIYSNDDVSTTGESLSAAVAMQKRITESTVAEVAVRQGNRTGTSASSFDYGQVTGSSGNVGSTTTSSGTTLSETTTTVRGRLTSRVPFLPAAQVFAEVEQDVNSEARSSAVGGGYTLTESTRLYGRYEFLNSLASAYNLNSSTQRNVGLVGIENKYTQGGQLYNEYRLADTDTGRTATNAAGARQTFKLSEHWSGTAGIELTRALNGSSSATSTSITQDATAILTGLTYTNGGFRSSANLEWRNASTSDTISWTSGSSYRFTDSLTALSRSLYTRTEGSSSLLIQARQQIGLAYRPIDDDSWNGLLRYEHKYQNAGDSTTSASGATVETASSLSGSSTTGITDTHVLAGLINWQPNFKTQVTGRYAVKTSLYDADGISSRYWAQLIHGRYIRDIGPNWDMGVQSGILLGQGGAMQTTFGVEAGYQVMKNTWVSAGYNILGLKDPDLTVGEYTSKGPYLRFRVKLDENSLSFGDNNTSAYNTSPPPNTQVAASPAKPVEKPAKTVPRSNWMPGQALPDYVEWREDLLYDLDGSAMLNKQGSQLIAELLKAISKYDIKQIQFSLGHGDSEIAAHTNDPRLMLWLKRVKEVKKVLAHQLGPKLIDVSVDSSPYEPANYPRPSVGEARYLHVVINACPVDHIPPPETFRTITNAHMTSSAAEVRSAVHGN